MGSFNVSQLGDKPDKIGKDDNFRGETISENVLYYTKGSGLQRSQHRLLRRHHRKRMPHRRRACRARSAPSDRAAQRMTPDAVEPRACRATCASSAASRPTSRSTSTDDTYPFGIWFANPHTLYLADEGNGDATYSSGHQPVHDRGRPTTRRPAEWIYDTASQTWKLAYTLQNGLALGTPYTVAGYPVGDNAATSLPWAPATDGLRNLTGRVNRDGSVTLYAVTSTVSGSGDQGADPNQLVSITDRPAAAAPSSREQFTSVLAPKYGQAVRGVTLAPDSHWRWSGSASRH